MTSFGATNIIRENYMPTFKIQGQIYHRAGSLLPLPNEEHKFLQIYFMGDADEQIDQRCRFNVGTKREVVAALQTWFDQHNGLIRLFRTAVEQMPFERHYNAPTIDEVAIVIVGE
ncbi:unnamed protein product [Ceutorhynchus assimilis]|uniref:Uncharacterized protein n=1 Tax=Ceutorhynchus assimilis TaxID=467358 RepID=A0A9N9QCD3_9CUCU|nr:unnamed protein product [Ceutorhynchus assimilis]